MLKRIRNGTTTNSDASRLKVVMFLIGTGLTLLGIAIGGLFLS